MNYRGNFQPGGLAGWDWKDAVSFVTGGAVVLPTALTVGTTAAAATAVVPVVAQGIIGTAASPLAPFVPILAPVAAEIAAVASVKAADALQSEIEKQTESAVQNMVTPDVRPTVPVAQTTVQPPPAAAAPSAGSGVALAAGAGLLALLFLG